MSDYYRPKRIRNLYDPKSKDPFRISRSKLDLFLNCPRCFYIDRKLGVAHPPGYPFNLNSAVDALLKKEFDYYREKQQPHPLFESFGVKAIPFKHEKIDEWRDSLRRGITYLVPNTNLLLTGGVDDVWWNPNSGEIFIVDYKATSKSGEVSLDAEWQKGYKRQAEIYQWLFKMNGFETSDVAYFVYCNGKTDRDRFDKKLDFDVKIIPYNGDSNWVEQTVYAAFNCLNKENVPAHTEDCDHCEYVLALAGAVVS